jgi:hypothetical protein
MRDQTTQEQSDVLQELFPNTSDKVGENFSLAWSVKALIDLLPKDEYRLWHLAFGHYNDDDIYVPEWYCGLIDSSKRENRIIESCGEELVDVLYETIIKINKA